MANATELGKSYVKQVLALMQGNTDAAIAQYNYRKASNVFKSQISALEGDVPDFEDKVEEAKEALKRAIYPTEKIEDKDAYFANYIKAWDELNVAEMSLEHLKEDIELYKGVLAQF